MAVCHRNPADDRADDSDEPLVGPAQEQIAQVCCSVEFLLWSTVDCAVVVRGESPNGFGGEHIGIDDVTAKVRNEAHARGHGRVVPIVLLTLVLELPEVGPAIRIGDRCQTYKARLEVSFVQRVLVIVRRTDDPGPDIAQAIAASFPVEFRAVVVKDDRLVKAYSRGLAVQNRDRFDERHLTGLLDLLLAQMVAHSERLDHAGARKNPLGRQDGSVFEFDRRNVLIFDMELGHPAAELELSSEFAESAD